MSNLIAKCKVYPKEFPNLTKLFTTKLPFTVGNPNKRFKYIDVLILKENKYFDRIAYHFNAFEPTVEVCQAWLQKYLDGEALVEYAILRMRGFKTE